MRAHVLDVSAAAWRAHSHRILIRSFFLLEIRTLKAERGIWNLASRASVRRELEERGVSSGPRLRQSRTDDVFSLRKRMNNLANGRNGTRADRNHSKPFAFRENKVS